MCKSLIQVLYMYLSLIITILDIINSPLLHLKHNVSGTGFCLHFQTIATQLGPIDRASLFSGPGSVDWAKLSM
jgi:hypothetical protein